MLGAGILNSALSFLLYAYAAQSLGAGFLSVADAVTPVWGAAVGWLWLRDTMPWTRSAGLGVALLGIAILVWDRLTFDPGGTGPVVLAAVAAPHSSQLDQAIPRGRQSPTKRHGQHGCRHSGHDAAGADQVARGARIDRGRGRYCFTRGVLYRRRLPHFFRLIANVGPPAW